MANCNTNTQCKDIPQCTSRLVLFTAPEYMGDPIYVYVKNLCNDHVVRYEGVVNYEGDIEIELAQSLQVGCSYLLWINDELETPSEQSTFTIDSTSATVLEFGAFQFYDENYTALTGYTAKLTLA